MARKKKHEAHANHERWLVSYADFITLLFAFFVVMFASSQTDKAKAQQVSEAVSSALENGGIKAAVHEILGGTVDDLGKGSAQMKGPGGSNAKDIPNIPQTAQDLLPKLKYLSDALKEEIKAGKMEIKQEDRGLVISMQQAAFFPSGDDTIDPARYDAIEKIAVLFKDSPNPIRLEGHTDSVPIHTPRFHSNYELSAARGIAMLDLLANYGVAHERLAVVGYADTVPKASNDTPEGRAKNRRVDIVILNEKVEGPQAEAKPSALAAPPAATAKPPASQATPPQAAAPQPAKKK